MKGKRKYLLLMITVILTALLSTGLAACVDDTPTGDDVLYPTDWKIYIDDYVKLMSNSYYIAEDGINADLDFEVNVYNRDTKNYEIIKIVFRLNLSARKYYNENALVLEIYKSNANFNRKKIFSLYGDNENLFLQIYEDKYDKESRYHYTNAPLLDLIVRNYESLKDDDVDAEKAIRELADNMFTDCEVNADKTIYNFKFSLASLIMSVGFGEFENFLGILPSDVTSAVYGVFGAENAEGFKTILLNTQAVLVVMREGDQIKNMQIHSIESDGEDINGLINVIGNKIALSKTPIIGLKKAMPDPSDYEKTKVATMTVFGSIKLKSTDKLKTLVTYDLELNMSIDLLELILNNGDIKSLSDDNYFHLSISHKCGSACGDYCSVELGNKFMPSIGSVFDVAFSPSDFGTHNIYVVTSLKSLLGKNSLKSLNINDGLLNLVLSDYQLLALESRSGINAVSGETEQPDKPYLYDFIKLLNLRLWGGEAAVSDLSELFKTALGNTQLADALNGIIFSNPDVGYIEIDCKIPQYGAVRTYDIAQRALFITSEVVDDGVVGVKQYDNALFASNYLPPLSWKFDDGNYIDPDTFINNIYSADGELIYGIKDGRELPISPDELKNINGGMLKFSYTDIYNSAVNSNGDQNVGQSRILGVANIDYANTSGYQKVTLKLSAPTRISFPENRLGESIIKAVDEYLYIYVVINIKLTPINKNGITLSRTDKDENGVEITDYRIASPSSSIKKMVTEASAVINYANGLNKTVTVYGDGSMFDNFDSILSGYIFNTLGECVIKYKIAGKEFDKKINVIAPDTAAISREGDSVFRLYEGISLSSVFNARINIAYLNPSSSANFKINKTHYYIDGRQIMLGSVNWGVISDGINECIEFYREGTYTITVEYLGYKYSYDIKIVSENMKPSTYKLTSKTTPGVNYYKGNTYTFYYELDNKTFGISGLDNQSITMELRRMNTNGYYVTADETDAIITEMKIDGVIVNNGSAIDLPAIIYKPIKIQYKVNFIKSGKYILKMFIPNFAGDTAITVNES